MAPELEFYLADGSVDGEIEATLERFGPSTEIELASFTGERLGTIGRACRALEAGGVLTSEPLQHHTQRRVWRRIPPEERTPHGPQED